MKYLMIGFISLLSACAMATQTTPAKANKNTEHASAYKAPNAFNLSGAIAARSSRKAWTASINWLQKGPGAYQIRLSGPLGSGTVLIQKRGAVVSFRDGRRMDTSSDASALLAKHTGIRLPVNSLYYWVRGVPAPGNMQGVKKDAAGRLLVLRQNGYTISYTYSGNLPSQVRLEGNGVAIKLVIKHWNF